MSLPCSLANISAVMSALCPSPNGLNTLPSNFIAKWASMNTSANQSEPKLPSAFWLAALTLPKGKYFNLSILCTRQASFFSHCWQQDCISLWWLAICIQQYNYCIHQYTLYETMMKEITKRALINYILYTHPVHYETANNLCIVHYLIATFTHCKVYASCRYSQTYTCRWLNWYIVSPNHSPSCQ